MPMEILRWLIPSLVKRVNEQNRTYFMHLGAKKIKTIPEKVPKTDRAAPAFSGPANSTHAIPPIV